MRDPALGHPASRAHPLWPTAPPAISVTIAVDVFLMVCAAAFAISDAPWWSFVLPLTLATAILTVYGRRAAEALGIHSRKETPRAWLTALAVPAGIMGALAANAGRYTGLVIVTYIVLAHGAERLIWARFLASRSATRQP